MQMAKRLEELEARVQDARAALNVLEQQAEQEKEKAQHEVVDELEAYLERDSLQPETLRELSEEAWHEMRDFLDKLISRVKQLRS
jgi:replication-associated recombination protein RarA